MTPTRESLDLIKRFEGCRLTAYADSVGVPTIGYGHTADVKLTDTCTQDQADAWLSNDAKTATDTVMRLVTAPLTMGQIAALTSFVFNLGATRLAKSTLLHELNRRDFESAAAEFNNWVFAGGKIVHGLVERRAAEKAMFES